jgi:hypothetical protein
VEHQPEEKRILHGAQIVDGQNTTTKQNEKMRNRKKALIAQQKKEARPGFKESIPIRKRTLAVATTESKEDL